MTFRSEILNHLGKGEIKLILDSPNILNLFKFSRALAFILIMLLYCLLFNTLSHAIIFFKIAMPSSKNIFESHVSSGFWTLCIYILVRKETKNNIFSSLFIFNINTNSFV
jgi:hypothetical protein